MVQAVKSNDGELAERVHHLVKELNAALSACAGAGLVTEVRETASFEQIGGRPHQLFISTVARPL